MLTSFWIINNSKKKEIRLQQEFQAFLDEHSSFKMTLEEVVFILGRNGMSMVDLSQDFDETTTAANFKTFIQELVSLSGQLLANLTDVLYCFFKSREIIGKVDDNANVMKYAGSKNLANMFVKADKEYMISKENMSETPMVAACSEEVSLKITNLSLDEKSSKIQESQKKIPFKVFKVKQESDNEVVKVEEENKCLRNEKNQLEEKLNVLKKDREHRRFENTAFVEILALILEGGSLDVAKLNNAGYRNVVVKIKQLLQKSSIEVNKTNSMSRKSNESVEESIAGTEVEEEDLAEVEDEALAEEQKTVRVRLFQTGSHSALQEPHLVPIPLGTQLLPLSALQVVD